MRLFVVGCLLCVFLTTKYGQGTILPQKTTNRFGIMLYLPLGQNFFDPEPASIETWSVLLALGLTVLLALELHKLAQLLRKKALDS